MGGHGARGRAAGVGRQPGAHPPHPAAPPARNKRRTRKLRGPELTFAPTALTPVPLLAEVASCAAAGRRAESSEVVMYGAEAFFWLIIGFRVRLGPDHLGLRALKGGPRLRWVLAQRPRLRGWGRRPGVP